MAKTSINPPFNSHSPLPFQNGLIITNDSKPHDDDIELITFEMMNQNYTSLKDLIPLSPPSTVSPTSSRMDSWREIPIKDPLVQHAAWAYLQPMEAERGDDERWWWEMIKDKCCGIFGCLNEVVLVVLFGGLVVEDEEQEVGDCCLEEDQPCIKS